MTRFLFVVAALFLIAFGFHALNATSGEVALTVGDTAYAVDLPTAVLALIATILLTIGLGWFVRRLVRSPWRYARHRRRRLRGRGRQAVAQGLIAIAAGDVRSAERAAHEAARRDPNQPLALLLRAQTAQLKGDRDAARKIFQEMTEEHATRIAGLRGLYIEAEREGENEAARQIAEKAREEAPAAPWAVRALLRHQILSGDWDGALRTLAGAADGRILDKRTARRQRAVILTAKALAREEGEPDIARAAAIEAHDLAPDLVPAAVAAGRVLARQGDVRRATRVLESAWKAAPHPELAQAYLHVRPGDSAGDRLKRAEALFRMRPLADEGRFAIAAASIDAREFSRAREILTPLIEARPTRNAFILMAELEEAETGDVGRAREWLARAVHAPRDAAWTADGTVLEAWAPASPVTGRIDAVEWKVPIAELAGPVAPAGPDTVSLPPRAAARIVNETPPTPETARAIPLPVARAPSRAPESAQTIPTWLMRRETGEPAAQTAAASEALNAGSGKASARQAGGPPPLLIPDDPGVGGDELEDEEERRLRAF